MKHISILVYEEVLLTALSSVTSLLHSANDVMSGRGKQVAFDIELVSVNSMRVKLKTPVEFVCTKTIQDEFETDVIIIPPTITLPEDIDNFLSGKKPLIDWVR